MNNIFDRTGEIAWCPGCGNFGLNKIILSALKELNLESKNLVFVSGIGQAAKAPQYMNVHYFNGLHGRTLPVATGIKVANPNLIVIVESGDGDMYGEGGNHFIHTIRRNPDITVIVHNNMVYGLTKGQASPTSQKGMTTPVQVDGVFEHPINPITLAISLNASFVARGSVGEPDLTKELIKKAILHKGFALVDVFQACVSFNKINTHKWFKENTYKIDNEHDPKDKIKAFELSLKENPFPIGLFFLNKSNIVFEENLSLYKKNKLPLFKRKNDIKNLILEQKNRI